MKVLKPLTLALSRRAREQSFEALLPGEKGLGCRRFAASRRVGISYLKSATPAELFHDRQRKIKPCHSHGNGNPARAEPLTLRAWIPGRALQDLPGMTMGLFFLNNETARL